MDQKLEMMLDMDMWRDLFKKFDLKHIDYDIRAKLSQPKYRLALVRMIEDGVYEIDPPRVQQIPKDTGGFREVYILDDIHRCTVAAANEVYYKLYSNRIHKNCVSYQKGLSVPNTLHKIKDHLVYGGYKVDLSKYFDSVPREQVNSLLKSMDTGSPLDKLLWDFYNDDRIVKDGVVVEHYKSLGQGCATSSLLANLCLADIDEKLSKVCKVYVRYSDDILMLGDRADEALAMLKEELSKIGLSLNPKKIERIDSSSEFTFLGGRICKDYVHMSERSRNRIKKAIKHLCKVYGRKNDRKAQKRVLDKVKRFFIGTDGNGHSNLQHISFLCTDETDVEFLDWYARNEIRAAFTGKHNFTRNMNKTSDDDLKEMGWVSLVHLYRLYQNSSHVYNAKISALAEHVVNTSKAEMISSEHASVILSQNYKTVKFNLVSGVMKVYGRYYSLERIERPGLFEYIEELWGLAKRYEGFTALNTQPDRNHVYSNGEYDSVVYALRSIEFLIISSKPVFDKYYWQSKKYPELVLFRDWFTGEGDSIEKNPMVSSALGKDERCAQVSSAFTYN